MKKILLVLVLGTGCFSMAQNVSLKKGTIVDSLKVNDSISESFALYLPKQFDIANNWPVVFVFDMQGRAKQSIAMLKEAAEQEGYILAASNDVRDSLSITNNVLISSRMIGSVASMFRIAKNRVYTAGFSSGARLASIIPTFIKDVNGVISCGASITNVQVLDVKKPFHFIGIVGNEDYNYPEMIKVRKVLDKMRFPNQLLVYEGGADWPSTEFLAKAMEIFTLAAMTNNNIPRDTTYIQHTFRKNLNAVNQLISSRNPLLAYDYIEEMIRVYQSLVPTDSLKDREKALGKDKFYRAQNRSQSNVFFKESLIKEDYGYYLEEDVLTYNYNNLGWWNFQMQELDKYDKSSNRFERQMGKRLRSYLNALISDHIDLSRVENPVDLEAINFLWMLKTITAPQEFDNYLNVISISAQMNDYGTALFYLEELLKNGFTDKARLYSIDHTALLRITPEFNEIVLKYLKDARYDLIEE